jgi:peptide-methionine (S)-S-oxide reductase
MGYAVAAVGNHEFDYGPVGDPLAAQRREADPQGALRARAREARFPLLTANLVDPHGAALAWENVRPAVTLTAAGVRVGVLGLSTESTVHGVGSGNTRGVALRPLADALRAEAAALRAAGADVVVAVAHAGGHCTRFDDPDDLASCDPEQELFRVLRAAPEGVVDVVVGYSGGSRRNPTYENHEGHLEAIRVTWDPARITYSDLVTAFYRNIDPTDPNGQICDIGPSYRTAVFVADDAEKRVAEQVKADVARQIRRPVATRTLPRSTFWMGEGYHQDYAAKNPGHYNRYRVGCGRDARIQAVWAGRG